jgi:DNA polymerase-3 subunit delta
LAKRQGDTARSGEQMRLAVQKGERGRFYLLHGEDDFSRERLFTWLDQTLSPEAVDFNRTTFHGDRFAPEEFLRIYYSYPMMAGHRLLLLKGSEKLSINQCRDLEQIINSPSESTIVIVTGGKIDLRRKLFQQLAKQGQLAEFRPPYESKIGQWIVDIARDLELEIEADAVDLLKLYIGNNLRDLARELDKIRTYLGEGRRVTATAVTDVVASADSGGIFSLADAIGGQEYPTCQRLLHDVLARGEDPARVLAMVVRHFKILVRTKGFMEDKSNVRRQLASHLGVAPFFVEGYAEQAGRYPKVRLWRSLSHLLRADYRLKSLGRRQQVNILEVMLFDLCAWRASAATGAFSGRGPG